MSENNTNTENRLLASYRGDSPFIFVSYAPEDVKEVFPQIKLLQNQGHNIVYNEEIKPSKKSMDESLPYIEDSEIFIIFVTSNATASRNIKKEFRYAIGEGKPILAIYFDDKESIEMSKGWKYELLDVKEILKNTLDKTAYISKINETINNIRENPRVKEEVVFYDDKPRIHASYCYDDFHLVSKEIRCLQKMGCNVSYGEGFESSKARLENSLKQIDECEMVVAFVTKNSAKSNHFYEEVKHAINEKKAILPIYLEDLDKNEMSPELKDELLNIQSIFKTNFEEGQYTCKLSESLQNFEILPKDPLNTRLVPGVGREPIPAYRGKNPYIFISYAHKDSYRVFPEIKRFQDLGYNVWYDEGIAPANEWLEDVVEHLDKCRVFIICLSHMSIASVNVKKELKYAINREKDIIPIFFDDFDELNMDREWKYLLSDIQGINKTKLGDEEYVFKCSNALERFGFEPLFESIRDEVFKKIELNNPSEILMEENLGNSVLYSDIDSKSISPYIDKFFDSLILYSDYNDGHYYKDLLKGTVDAFLEYKSFYNASNVYNIFFSIYHFSSGDENDVLELIGEFTKYENSLFIHSVNVFIMGLAIYAQNNHYRTDFEEYVKSTDYQKYYTIDGELSHEEFLFRWGIASLMHDIYSPFEIYDNKVSSQLYKKFDTILGKDRSIDNLTELNEIYKSDPHFDNDYIKHHDETKFIDLYKPTHILAHKISLDFPSINVNQVIQSLNSFIDFINKNQYEEHGFLSSLIILNLFCYEIQAYKMDSSFFYYPIADSASAVLLHTYYKYFLQKNPFNLEHLKPIQSPIAYLLILCDTMLEFYKNPETITDDNMNIISNLEITDEKFNADYIVNSTSYGFGFYNELFLDETLDIYALFNEGLSVTLRNVKQNAQIFKTDFDLNNYLIKNIEKLASEIYGDYAKTQKINGLAVEADYEKLSPAMKLNNVRQAQSIFINLSKIGYEIAPIDDERDAKELSDIETLYMARKEHENWCEDKVGNGWTYGEITDNENLTTPFLCPWNELPANAQQYNMDVVKNISGLFDSLGFKIVFSKKRLLSMQIYEFSTKNENTKSFDELDMTIKEMHYKNTDLIIKTLSKLDYAVIDKFYEGDEIESFSEEEIRYFAQFKHKEWYKLNSSLGWKYGEIYDEKSKTNPNLLAWEKLNIRYAVRQMKILENLPEFCDEVGLKITKNTINY